MSFTFNDLVAYTSAQSTKMTEDISHASRVWTETGTAVKEQYAPIARARANDAIANAVMRACE